jgi:methyl-accepting chemotaxis protein
MGHLISEIATATREQATGLHKINIAVNNVDQGTQQNAAMVEEQTAASHGLAGEASALTASLREFSLSASGAQQPRVRHAA